jgi:hypothetical protein
MIKAFGASFLFFALVVSGDFARSSVGDRIWFDSVEDLKVSNDGKSGLVFQYVSGEMDPDYLNDGKYYLVDSFQVGYSLNFIGNKACYIGNPRDIEFVEDEGSMRPTFPPTFVKYRAKLSFKQDELVLEVKEENRYFVRDQVQSRPFETEKFGPYSIPRCQ